MSNIEINGRNQTLMLVISYLDRDFSLDFTERVTYSFYNGQMHADSN